MHKMLLACFGMVAVLATFVSSPVVAKPTMYSVIFEVQVDDLGELSDLKVAKVIDPMSGSASPVNVDVPQVYIDAVRKRILSNPKEPGARTYFTYSYFRPALPDVVP